MTIANTCHNPSLTGLSHSITINLTDSSVYKLIVLLPQSISVINYVNLSKKFDTNGSMIIIRFYVIKPEELFRNGNSNLDNPFLDLFDSFTFKKIIAALSFCHYLSFDTCNQFFLKTSINPLKCLLFILFFICLFFI